MNDEPQSPHRAEPRRADHTAWRSLGDETIVVDLTNRRMYGLNDDAGRLFELLDGERSIADLANDIDGTGAAEIGAWLHELGALGLVEHTPEDELPQATGPAAIVWREEIQQAAATCAFLPGQNILCNSGPFS